MGTDPLLLPSYLLNFVLFSSQLKHPCNIHTSTILILLLPFFLLSSTIMSATANKDTTISNDDVATKAILEYAEACGEKLNYEAFAKVLGINKIGTATLRVSRFKAKFATSGNQVDFHSVHPCYSASFCSSEYAGRGSAFIPSRTTSPQTFLFIYNTTHYTARQKENSKSRILYPKITKHFLSSLQLS